MSAFSITVYANSIEHCQMESKPEAEWPDEFTREEMLEQQSRLLIEECHLLQLEVSRYRQNIAKLIDMNATVTAERDKLEKSLAEAEATVSRLFTEAYGHSREIGSIERVPDQHRAVMRNHKIPGYYFEPDWVHSGPVKVNK